MSKDHLQDNLKAFIVPVELLDGDLDIYEKMTYVVLRSFADARESKAFPSYETIARAGSMSRRKAIDCVDSLIKKGYLHKEYRLDVSKNRKIRNTSNLYSLTLPSERHALGVVHSVHQGSAQRALGVVHSVHQGSAQRAPKQNHRNKTIKNKTKEQQQEKENVVVVSQRLRDFFSEKNIPVTDQVFSDWLKIADEETVLQAATEAIGKRKKIETIVGYIGGMLRRGYTPSVQVEAAGMLEDKLPESVVWQQEMEKAQKEAAATSERKTVEDDPELKAMLESLRKKDKG